MNQSVSVVIPVYKIDLTESERMSLSQCLNLLYKYDISFVCSKSFDFELFCKSNEVNQEKINISRISFANEYFSSIEGYNRLLLSEFFYESFSDFEYILIYQLDAWVFNDELGFWVSQNYDYIGAPWIGEEHGNIKNRVGNGGFSLRRVNAFLKIFKSLRFRYYRINHFSKIFNDRIDYLIRTNTFLYILKVIKALLMSTVEFLAYKNTLKHYFMLCEINEDILWGVYAPIIFQEFKIPSIDVAMRFSIETNPENTMLLISPNLPFGCHAWEKLAKSFWQPFINSSLVSNQKLS